MWIYEKRLQFPVDIKKRDPKSDVIVLLSTFFLTVSFDLTLAISVGMVFTALLFMKRMSDVSSVQNVSKDINICNISEDTLVYEINGPLFFGAAEKFTESIKMAQDNINTIILKMDNVPAMDATASNALEVLYENCKLNEISLILYGLQNQPYSVLKKSGFINKIGIDNICNNIDEALIKPA